MTTNVTVSALYISHQSIQDRKMFCFIFSSQGLLNEVVASANNQYKCQKSPFWLSQNDVTPLMSPFRLPFAILCIPRVSDLLNSILWVTNFVCDLLCSYFLECQKNEIYFLNEPKDSIWHDNLSGTLEAMHKYYCKLAVIWNFNGRQFKNQMQWPYYLFIKNWHIWYKVWYRLGC